MGIWKLLVVSGVSLVVLTVIVRTIYFSRRSPPVQECKPTDSDFIPLTEKRLRHLQQALQFKTVTTKVQSYDTEELKKFGEYIIKEFPTLHSSPLVTWERVNNYSLLYHVKGRNPDLRPYLLMSHLDVVPATDLNEWDRPPFSGDEHEGFIYGRGAIDVKQCVMGILEAVEYLLLNNVRPVRSFYIAFGHDEEGRGLDGAGHVSQRLKEKGLTSLEYVADEGLTVTEGIVPGVSSQVASLGISEKGYLSLRLSVEGKPGHSSFPPKETTIGILAAAVHKLESNPHPSMLGSEVETKMFEDLAPEMSFLKRAVLVNSWLFKPLTSWVLSRQQMSNAMIRTTTAVTIIKGGIKENVIPPSAEAVVNHRVHPSQTVEEVIEYDRALIGDSRVKIEVVGRLDPCPISAHGDTDFGYQVMKTSIQQIWPKALVVPGILIGNTDTHYYMNFTSNIYRFSPTHMFPDDPPRFHGLNERISKKNYEQVINFFHHLIQNSDQSGILIGNTDTHYYMNFTSNIYRFSPTHMFPDDPPRFHGLNERISKKNYEQVINFFHHLIQNSDQTGVSPVHGHHDDL